MPNGSRKAKFDSTTEYKALINKLANGQLEESYEDYHEKVHARKKLYVDIKQSVSKDVIKNRIYTHNTRETDLSAMLQNEVGLNGFDHAKKITHDMAVESTQGKD